MQKIEGYTVDLAFDTDLVQFDLSFTKNDSLEPNPVFGLIGFVDPVREGAADAIAECRRAGIRVVMITGDHPRTAARIAADLGIIEPGNAVLSGTELDALDDARDLQRRDDIAQVAGHRCSQGNQLHGPALGLDLQRVQLLVVFNDARGALNVALLEAAHRLADGMLGKAAHFADQRPQPIEIVVERLECMSFGHVQ